MTIEKPKEGKREIDSMLSCKRNGFAFIFYGKSSISFFHLSEIELLFWWWGNKMAEISRLKDKKKKGKREFNV